MNGIILLFKTICIFIYELFIHRYIYTHIYTYIIDWILRIIFTMFMITIGYTTKENINSSTQDRNEGNTLGGLLTSWLRNMDLPIVQNAQIRTLPTWSDFCAQCLGFKLLVIWHLMLLLQKCASQCWRCHVTVVSVKVHSKVCGSYVVTLLDQTLIFECCVGFIVKNGSKINGF